MRVFKYQPEGSAEDYEVVQAGPGLSREEAKEARQKLASDPDDLRSRLLLFGRGSLGNSGSYAQHLNWLIDNYPKGVVHCSIYLGKSDDVFAEAKRRWLLQVRANPDDVTILVHAAEFSTPYSLADAAKCLIKASELDEFNDDMPRQLSNVYLLMACNDSTKKSKLLARKSAEQLKIAIERYALPNPDGESYLLPYYSMVIGDTAETLLRLQLVAEARELAQLLIDHRAINKRRWESLDSDLSTYRLSQYRAHVILGKAEIADGNIQAAKRISFVHDERAGRLVHRLRSRGTITAIRRIGHSNPISRELH